MSETAPFRRLAIPDVLMLRPKRSEDARGAFSELWNRDRLQGALIDVGFVQENLSLTRPAGALRGLHFQAPPRAQAKLVRCSRGRIFDVAVDIRKGSPWFGRWVGAELSPAAGEQLYVPEGFLHGFLTLEPETEVVYHVTATYAPGVEGAVRWDDPDLAIAWPLPAGRPPILSDKDSRAPRLADLSSPFVFEQGAIA